MRTEPVEIYSDASNQAILRHPGRRFPGVLIQGDTLKILHAEVAGALREVGDGLSEDARLDLEHVRDFLGGCLEHYRAVLGEHDMELPFAE
ncbi:MAG: hypothetical protein M0D54_01665 [Hyphomonadaceae bacterium JAD_PAG50586_4]|nr:MAG: hypothetical protein M0D54_01665 [Hyphomonadaceae bacterium JAD_PAG50586_4]